MLSLMTLLLSPGCAAAAIGDDCFMVGAQCILDQDQRIVVVHGRQLKKSDIRCNSKKICVDTSNKVEISEGIWMPSINLGTWFAKFIYFCF